MIQTYLSSSSTCLHKHELRAGRLKVLKWLKRWLEGEEGTETTGGKGELMKSKRYKRGSHMRPDVGRTGGPLTIDEKESSRSLVLPFWISNSLLTDFCSSFFFVIFTSLFRKRKQISQPVWPCVTNICWMWHPWWQELPSSIYNNWHRLHAFYICFRIHSSISYCRSSRCWSSPRPSHYHYHVSCSILEITGCKVRYSGQNPYKKHPDVFQQQWDNLYVLS